MERERKRGEREGGEGEKERKAKKGGGIKEERSMA